MSADSKEMLDIELCYKALDAVISDSPEQIEQKYQKMMGKCKLELRSPDPQVRENAKDQIPFIEAMYHKITTSVTYITMSREHEKRNRDELKPAQAKTPVMSCSMMHCPSCNSVISNELKTCPRCRADLRSTFEIFVQTFLSKTAIAVFCFIALLVVIFFLGMSYPEKVEELVNLFR